MEVEVAQNLATPATCCLLDGKIRVGLDHQELERLGTGAGNRKIGARELSSAAALGWSGGTTVSGTLVIAKMAGIRVFATGGIGGVHRNTNFDISSDLKLLANTPLVVVCSGAKNILDLPATVEYLETMSVPVIGFKTDRFPAFLSGTSNIPLTISTESVEDIRNIALNHWALGLQSALLIVVPLPEAQALAVNAVDEKIDDFVAEAARMRITGQAVTPFLLERLRVHTNGVSISANKKLLLNNAKVAAEIAVAISN